MDSYKGGVTMACLRCGKKTDENQIFCPECLEIMEKQPVKPDTPIQIPNRASRSLQKRTSAVISHRNSKKLRWLRSPVLWLVILAVLLAAALALCICIMLQLTPEWVNETLFGDTAYQLITKKP